MDLPQLPGLMCARCQRAVGSITDGVFCSICGNPVHVKCHKPDDVAQAHERCGACGGEVSNPIAVQVRTVRAQEQAGLFTGTKRLACPDCGSARGFRPFQSDSGDLGGPGLLIVSWLFFPVLLVPILFGMSTSWGRVQCLDCDYVFRPPNRARDIGCLVVLALTLGVAILLYLMLILAQ